MKVCFVSHSGDKGGATAMLLRLMDGLQTRDVECSVLLPWSGPLKGELETRRVAHAVYPYRWWAREGGSIGDRLRDLWALRQVRPMVSQLRRWDVDLIVTNTITPPSGALAALILRKPHIWYIHEFGRADHGLSFYLGYALTGKLMSRLSRFVIVNSRAVRDFYSRYISPEKIRVVYCGVDLPPRNETPDGSGDDSRPPRLVMMATYHPGKGHVVAMRALKQLLDQQVKAQLIFAGAVTDRHYFELLKKTASDLHLENSVSFEPYREDPGSIMAEADVVLMCSRSEAFGLVTVEAMKMGKPVVGARAGATPELIQEGVTGLLYEPNEPADLAAKIRRLLENPADAKRMGENGQRWADAEFSTKAYVESVLRVFNDALHGAREFEARPSRSSS